ncbi:hypothetical protein TL16_g05714 [Triparma laevis f. inornata]|uniref:Uncharacterized protein n=1 Tax=Triparma laevis f. inornata TaxID=1714386 RepID=A0A9W7ECW4_9STRA|nr:hypothetical protein TL16_g05714 [Triparma laevis f. inornata]
MSSSYANAKAKEEGTLFLTGSGLPTPALLLLCLCLPVLLHSLNGGSKYFQPSDSRKFIAVVIGLVGWKWIQGGMKRRRGGNEWTFFKDEFCRGDYDHVMKELRGELEKDSPNGQLVVEALTCLLNQSSKISETPSKTTTVISTITEIILPEFNVFTQKDHNYDIVNASLRILMKLPSSGVAHFLEENPDAFPPVLEIVKRCLKACEENPEGSLDEVGCKTLTSTTLFLSKISTPKVVALFVANDISSAIVPILSYFQNDVRVLRNVLLLLFNLVYENEIGKGQMVRAAGVEGVIDTLSRNVDVQDGVVLIVHGMGVMFDLLRISSRSDDGTCLNTQVAQTVRQIAKAKGELKNRVA